jgi:transcriptional regulator with GAF, ATPase, and Fis domain
VTEIVDRLRPRLELPGLELSVVSGPDLGQRIVATRGTLRVGASRDNDLVLTDPSVSRRHFQVHLRAGAIQVEDLGSTNGTTVDGVRVLAAILAPGSLVQIGNTTIRATSVDRPLEIALSTSTRFGALLGASVEMRRAFAILERVAPTDATVLIHGETGTGKELAAEAIHTHSPRAEGPFVTFDCSAVAPSLVESELFGHVRGAFSGAVADRRGVFEAAHGGTLFLDEIGELPLELQPKLLRVLESRQVSRVGESRWRPLDVRVVAATHRELAAEVNRGQFREDLYFRLAVVSLTMPALRTRMDDMPMLVRHFWERFAPGTEAPADLVRSFASRAWPGNVRELRNALERAVVLRVHEPASVGTATADAQGARALPAELEAFLDLPIDQAQERVEGTFWRAYLERALARSGGSVSGAARAVGTNRRYIQRLMRRFDVRAPGDDPDGSA